MSTQVSIQALPMVLSLVRDDSYARYIASLGIAPVDWESLTGSQLWLPVDKGRMDTTLRQIVFGAIDLMALPRPTIPAEWAAAIISMLVNPINWMTACSLWSTSPPTVDLIDGDANIGNIAPVGRDRMFALCTYYAASVSSEQRLAISNRLQAVFNSGLPITAKEGKK